jgi:hypothetical protein
MMLDLGANVDCEPQHLLQFAEMGHALVAALEGKERPTIGLLNIGEEVIKGNETIKRAGELLRASTLNSAATSKATTSTRARPTCRLRRFRRQRRAQDVEGLAQMLVRHHQGGVRPFAG